MKDEGPLDLFGEVPGLGTFEYVDQASDEVEIANTRLLVLTIEGLERAKRAAGRPKDLVDLGYLRALTAQLRCADLKVQPRSAHHALHEAENCGFTEA